MPYTWGDTKNGKLGIDLNDEEVMTNQLYSKKEKRFTAPALIPYFEDILRKKSNVTAEKAELLRQKYNANNNNKLEELAAEDFESDTQIEDVDFELRFEV